MKLYKILILLLFLSTITTTGCVDNIKKINQKTPVMHLNMFAHEDDGKMTLDLQKTDRHIEYLPLLKQTRYDKVEAPPYIAGIAFYNTDKISYIASTPYNGPGNYTLSITFEDGKLLPKSSNESILVKLEFIDAQGQLNNVERISVRWA